MKTSDIFIDFEALKPEHVQKLPLTEFEMLRPDCKETLHKMYPDVYARLQKEHETERTTRLDSKVGESTTDASKVPLHATHEPTHGSEYDVVSKPKHYASTSIECIDAMRETQGDEAVKHFCECNAFKYLWRHNSKNGDEDVRKASWYLNKAVEIMDKKEEEIREKFCPSPTVENFIKLLNKTKHEYIVKTNDEEGGST